MTDDPTPADGSPLRGDGSGDERADRGAAEQGHDPSERASGGGNADLWAVLALTALAVAVAFLPVVRETPLRWAVALAFVLFAPGYAVVSALFPGDVGGVLAREVTPGGPDDPRLPPLSRVVLGVGASVGAVGAVALTLDFTVWGFQFVPLLAGMAVFTVGAVAVAWRRRAAVPPARRFGVEAGPMLGRLEAFLRGESRLDAALSVLAVVCVLLAAGAVYSAPADDAGSRDVALLTRGENGLAAAGYERNLTQGEPTPYALRVGNGGEDPLPVTAVVQLQDVDAGGGSPRVVAATEVTRLRTTVPPGSRRVLDHEVTPATTGERLRLTYLVYFGDPPPTPSVDSADETVHLWVRVGPQSDGS